MKDLTSFLVPNLVINHYGKQYVVPPPSKDDGLLLAALNVVGVAAIDNLMGGTEEDALDRLSPVQRKLFEAGKDRDLGEISLGPAYKKMVKDKLPGPHIDQYAVYAMYYWVMGEETADAIFASMGEDAGPKAQKPSKSGPSTE